MRGFVAGIFRQRQPVALCGAHHWHYRSPYTHGRAWRGTGWDCCHCPATVPGNGAPPASGGNRCAHLAGDPEPLDRVETWLDVLQPS